MLVSVVVSCYHVEQYIEETVQSLINQSYKDLEIICVDDGSTDNTLEILRKLQQQDSRVKVIPLEKNMGTFACRAAGIKAAQGEYTTFLDGDDLLTPDIIKHAAELATQKQVDVVQFAVKPFIVGSDEGYTEHLNNLVRALKPSAAHFSHEQGALVEACFVHRQFSWNLCGKLFRTQTLQKGMQYAANERILMAEDLLTCFTALIFAKGYAALMEDGYLYRQGSGVTKLQEYFPLTKVRSFAEEYQVYDLLKKWLPQFGVEDKHRQALAAVRNVVFGDARHAYSKTKPTDREAALTLFAKYWPMAEMIEMLLGTQLSKAELGELVHAVRNLPGLQPQSKEIKTVGMFYYRMFNGGIERVIALLSNIFAAHGYRMVIFTDQKPNKLDYAVPASTQRVVLPTMVGGDLASGLERMQAWHKAIQEYQVDVMVYHAWINMNLYYDELFIKSAGIPLILHTHGPFSMNLRDGASEYIQQVAQVKKGYALCDLIVTLSEVDKAWSSALGFRTAHTINPPTFDIKDIQVSASTENNIIWVGRIADVKQPLEALKVMRLVHKKVPNAKLQMLGMADDPTSTQAVHAYLKEHKMSGYVSLEGHQADLKPYYKAARAVLWTAKDEGAPMGMVESKTYGLPIVAYDIANVDMIRESKGMLVVPQYDDQGAADHLVHLLTDKDFHAQVSHASRESAEAIFAIDQMKQWEAIFDIVTSPKPAELMGSQYPPMDTALQMMLNYLMQGEMTRQQQNSHAATQAMLSAAPAIPPLSDPKTLVKKIIKWCLPTGIVELRQLSLLIAGGSKKWIVKNTIRSILPYGCLRVYSMLKSRLTK